MRTSILLVCGIIVAFCLWLLLHQAKAIPKTDQLPTTARQSGDQQAPSNVVVKPQVPINLKTTVVSQASITPILTLGSTNAINPQLLADWQAPIEFYGKVVDENSNPVPSAAVDFRWAEVPTEGGNRVTNMESDAKGLFALHNAIGLNLSVSVSKDGYYTSRKDNGSFTFGSLGGQKFSPDSLNPVIFHLRRKGTSERLIKTDFPAGMGQIVQLHHDGTPIEIDLFNASQVQPGNGQLKLEFWRDISNINTTPFDWKLQLSVPGGGIVATPEEFAFQAPEDGYQPSIIIDMQSTNKDWQSEIRNKYYFTLSDGKFGLIDIYFLPRNGVFTIQSVINSSGSRNLEPSN